MNDDIEIIRRDGNPDVVSAESLYPETCGWLMQVPSGNPEPDFPGDCWSLVTCDGLVPSGSERCLCEYHLAALNLPEREFDRISEMHDGRAWS